MSIQNERFKDLSDEEVMALVQADDAAAFEELVERYQNRLMTFIARFLGRGPHVQDILQETFIRVWRHRNNYKTVAKFSTWVYTIASNLSKTELRRLKIRRTVPIKTGGEDFEEDGIDVIDPSSQTDDDARRSEIKHVVLREIERLPDVYRQAIVLRDLQDKSYEDIGEILSVPVGTVKSRVNRGRSRLRKRLQSLRD